jgi:quaternary ammonium compound-resistance protein SugE
MTTLLNSPWLILILAGICEIGWPLGYKFAQANEGVRQIAWFGFSGVSIVLSAWLLWLAQKEIPIGTAYAVWTGIGAAGTFLLGVMLFGEQSSLVRWMGAAMIIGGVIVLKAGQ